MKNLGPGSIIQGSHWPEPVEINLIEEQGDYVHLVGAYRYSRGHVDQLLSQEEFAHLVTANLVSTFSEEPWKVFLALETMRYRFASLYDPLLAMNTSKVDPLPHQIEAVYGYVLKLPRIRFLIADDPGAGKTIMAGLIIKELKLRHLVKRILIVAPGHLKDQWKRELAERFDETFVSIDRGYFEALYGENVWLREHQIITSIDFAKREEVLPSLAAAHFDLIVVDEAHKMSAYRYGDKISKTSRYRLGETLSRITSHLLFLTATPHKGDPDNYRLFLDLLEPGFFATNAMVHESIVHQDNPLFIRRVKEDLRDFSGKPLFLPRHVTTIPFNLGVQSPEEKELYNALSKYVNTQYNKALANDRRRNVAFALVILQRRLASSIYALHKSLERRKKRLEELLKGARERSKISEEAVDFETVEDLSEAERWQEEELWETLSVAENQEELVKEIQTLESLIQQAKRVLGQEIKLQELQKALQDLQQKYPDKTQRKILIFTESRDTLEYLENAIREWGYTTTIIHGGMKLADRIKAEKVFKTEAEILVATEAAGEGINLQFCHLLINYDLPWNPNRLEQRMGRIHRYGQQREVYVYNLVAEDTREGRVLHKMFQKLEEIRQALGSDKVFDVLSAVFYTKNLAQLLLEAAANARNIEEILQEIDIPVDQDYIARVKDHLGESLATRYIDCTRLQEMAQQAREYRLIPEYTEHFFKKAFLRAGGKLRTRSDGLIAVETIPFALRNIADQDQFKRSFGELFKRYPRVTFDKEIAFKNPEAEFVSFGHPLFEALLVWIEQQFSSALLQGATFCDPDGLLNGSILFYEGEIRDGTGNVAGKQLFACYVNDREIRAISPAVIWDLAEGTPSEGAVVEVESLPDRTLHQVIAALEAYRKKLLTERNRQAEIKQKYGIKSLEHFILTLDGELIALYSRKEQGENVDLVIRNKEERKAAYEQALEELKRQIEKERSLTMSAPRCVGIIRVHPPAQVAQALQSDAEIERIGMDKTMEYEREQGRVPEDVSADNLGFDIRSTAQDGSVRYIEVKARAETGAVALTQNEWFKAHRFKTEYYLYVVMNAAHNPELIIIQNPAEKLNPTERVEVVRYIISKQDLEREGIRVPWSH